MKNGTRNLFIGLGLAAGALLTASAFTGKTGKKVKNYISERLAKTQKKSNDDKESFYI